MFQRINTDELNGRQKEIYNFQKSAALLADYGFNCIKLADDWQGADFLAHHFDGKITLKVQLKARLTVDRKYIGQDLWMNFPSTGSWYLVPHDKLVETIGQNTNWLNTTSWQENGTYSDANPSPRLLEQLLRYRLQTGPEPSPRPTEPLAPPVSAVPVTKANPSSSNRDQTIRIWSLGASQPQRRSHRVTQSRLRMFIAANWHEERALDGTPQRQQFRHQHQMSRPLGNP